MRVKFVLGDCIRAEKPCRLGCSFLQIVNLLALGILIWLLLGETNWVSRGGVTKQMMIPHYVCCCYDQVFENKFFMSNFLPKSNWKHLTRHRLLQSSTGTNSYFYSILKINEIDHWTLLLKIIAKEIFTMIIFRAPSSLFRFWLRCIV